LDLGYPFLKNNGDQWWIGYLGNTKTHEWTLPFSANARKNYSMHGGYAPPSDYFIMKEVIGFVTQMPVS